MGLAMKVIRMIGRGLLVALTCALLLPSAVSAQPVGLDAGKDCHTFRTCNFGKRGSYRGCLSTYSCKVCRFVPAKCEVDGRRKVCQRLRCGWG